MEPLTFKSKLIKTATVFLILLCAYVGTKIIFELKSYDTIGMAPLQANTITLSGHGEVEATPDIASIDFSIVKDSSTVKDAQAGVAAVEKQTLALLAQDGVATVDIQTSNSSFYPKYEYQNALCPANPPVPVPLGYNSNPLNSAIYCPPGKQVLTGYEASESITVKIRNIDNVGMITQGLGTLGVTNLNGPNFTIDNPDALQVQAREKAIADAKQKAEILAKDLGVSLGKITSFNDSSNYPVYPMSMNAAKITSAAAPAVIPAGQTTITSDVSITYEIN